MNHRTPVAAVRRDVVGDDGIYSLAPGEFQFDVADRALFYGCPCGCGSPGVIPFPGSGYRVTWAWDGNRDQPTLDPSIRRLDGCKWHGHLKVGQWVPCGDSGA